MHEQKNPETLTWKAPSHLQHIRSSGWYLIFALISLGLLGFAYYIHSITAAITFILIIFVLLAISSQPSREITYKITKTEIVSGNVVYPYKIIKKFWIVYYPPEVKTLNLETSAYLNNQVVLQLGKQNPIPVKNALSRYLPEDLEKEESITEGLVRKLKI